MSATLNVGSFRSDDTLYAASRTLKSYLRSILMHKHGSLMDRPLIKLSYRPPNYETPLSIFAPRSPPRTFPLSSGASKAERASGDSTIGY